MSKKNCVLTVLLAAAVLFVMLSSVLFIAIEADHDCVGDGCPICAQIVVCENSLQSVGQAVAFMSLAPIIGSFMISLPALAKKQAYNTSLVSLKVKLSD